MAQWRTIFPLILFFPPLIFPVIPCPSLSALLCPHQDGTQKVQWGSLIRNFHGWLEPTFHCPSLDISLGKNSSRRYDWGGSTEKLEAKPLALKIKRCAVGNATARTSRVSQPSTLKSFKDLCCILSIWSEKIFQQEVFFFALLNSFQERWTKSDTRLKSHMWPLSSSTDKCERCRSFQYADNLWAN